MSNILNLKAVKLFAIIVLASAILATFGMVAVQKASANCSITTTLRLGSTGAEVVCLQTALGGLTADGKFGPMTKSAVMAFQAHEGLTADGVFGPASRAAWMANQSTGNFPAGCTSAVGFSTTTGGSCAVSSTLPAGCTSTSGFSTTTGGSCSVTTNLPAGCSSSSGFSATTGASCSGSVSGNLSGGETDVSGVSVEDADDDSINEGSSKSPVADIQFDVDDADAQLVRVDVEFQANDSNTDEDKPWRVFDKVYLMDGNTVLASMASDDEDAWDDADAVLPGTDFNGGSNDPFRIRFNNVNKIYNEGSNNNDLWVAVDVASSVDGAASGVDWGVGLDNDGLRFTDGAGIDTFAESSDVAKFSVEESGGDSDLTLTQDSSSPDAGNLEVDETTSTTATVAVFKVKADEDGGDVKFDDFPVQLTLGPSSATTFDQVVDDVIIEVDGNTYTTDTTVQTTAISADATQTFLFSDIEDDDVVVQAGDTMKVTVKVKFHSQGSSFGNYANGVTVLATSAADDSDFEDADTGDNIATQTLSTPSGETQTLYSTGISVSNFDSSYDTTTDNGSVTKETYQISFDVTAFGDTFYIPKIVERDVNAAPGLSDNDTSGLSYQVETSAGAVAPTADVTSSASSLTSPDADTVSSYFEVPEGETVTLRATIELSHTPSTGVAGFYHVQLEELLYDLDTTAVGSNETIYTFAPQQDFETQDAKVD